VCLALAVVEHLRCTRLYQSDAAHGFSPDFQVCLPYRGLFVWHVAHEDVVGGPNRVLFVSGGEEFHVQPGIIVTGSWLTVKEQMPEVCAVRLAERGYTAFTFDFAGFGESGGDPRQAEIPDRKIGDIIAAADFLSTLSLVEPDSIAHVALCASAQYGLAASNT
jgi:hypothetical protein